MAATIVMQPSSYAHSAEFVHTTPSDYLRLPDAYTLPHDKRFVGLLACQADPYLRTLETKIVRVEKRQIAVAEATTKNPGKAKKAEKKAAADAPASVVASNGPALVDWEFEFQDTVLFPEGGGQSCDHGVATLLEPSNQQQQQQIYIKNVFRRNLDAIHIASFPTDVDPTTLGWASGNLVRLDLDWARRRDHMQQHTGQHLLSAVFEQELEIDTHGWSLTVEGPCYVDLLKPPTQQQIEYVAKRCNELIAQGRKVSVQVKLDSERERPDTMPGDYKNGVVRYISIENLEVNPCCGTHAPSLAFLQSVFIFPGVQQISAPSRSRLYFAIGDRVLSSLFTFHTALKDVSGQFGCGIHEVPARVELLLKAKKEASRKEKLLRADAYRALAADLERGLKAVPSASSMDGGANGNNGSSASKVWVGKLHREEETTDIDFLAGILQEFKPPSSSEGDDYLVILTSGPFVSANSTNAPGGCVLMAGGQDLVKKGGDLVKTKLGGKVKGGGGRGRWQGKLTGGWTKADPALIDEILAEASAAPVKN
ncbi:hypothetical protein DFJ77DRAFT_507841 [Powellomyces hirtus]|nr:hypothetical protein DFJ77DRAFT_507841 [Powellomyces hirtus]